MIKAAMKPSATLFLAGAAPKDLEQVYKDAGVDDFISVKANCFQTLKMLQKNIQRNKLCYPNKLNLKNRWEQK